jgi:aminoglycoside phosphotransferase (APT) family kinase protein
MPGYDGPQIPNVDSIGMWLERNRPNNWKPGLIHGDFHIANVLAAFDYPGLAAIVDWELSTIGDPLLDLGWLLATWPDPNDPLPGLMEVEPWDGFPSSAELVLRYAERTVRDMSNIPWYTVLACFKLGIILEGTHARAAAGEADPATGDWLHTVALGLAARASTIIKSE